MELSKGMGLQIPQYRVFQHDQSCYKHQFWFGMMYGALYFEFSRHHIPKTKHHCDGMTRVPTTLVQQFHACNMAPKNASLSKVFAPCFIKHILGHAWPTYHINRSLINIGFDSTNMFPKILKNLSWSLKNSVEIQSHMSTVVVWGFKNCILIKQFLEVVQHALTNQSWTMEVKLCRYGGHLRPYLSVTCDPTPLKPETRSLATLPLFTAPTTQNYTWSLATLPTTTRENATRSLATLPTQIGRVTSDH